MTKKELRKEILARRNGLLPEERQKKSQKIVSRVFQLKEFQDSDVVLLYAPIRSEVDTIAIFQKAKDLGKEIYYPCVIGEEMEFFAVEELSELKISTFGIAEPEPLPNKMYNTQKEDNIFMLMPGAAFDEEGNRIGYGGGYYDKYIEKMNGVSSYKNMYNKNLCKVAIAYNCQMVELNQIQNEPHDVKVDYVVTESNIYKGEI